MTLGAWAGLRTAGALGQERLRFPPPVQPRAPLGRFEAPLRIPGEAGLLGTLSLGGEGEAVVLAARHAPIPMLPGPPTVTWAYEAERGGRTLTNPVLRVRRGAAIAVRLENQLSEDTTIHWHGMSVDEHNDGSGLHPVPARDHREYAFTVRDPAGMYWYHAHPHYRTGYQLHRGLAGVVLVEESSEEKLRRALGLQPFVNELPLVIQDRQLDVQNQLQYSHVDDAWIGNRVLVNGTPEPRWTAARRLTRLRLLNASNARLYRLALLAGERPLPFWLIGTDGGLLEAPLQVREVFLAPAQRLDVLADFSRLDAGTRVRLSSLAFDPMEQDGLPEGDVHLEHPGAAPMGRPLDLMAIDLEGPSVRAPALPARLGAVPRSQDGKPDRTFRLHIDGGRWLINGRNHHDDLDRPRFDVKRGAREIWELRNDTRSMPHPMHVHALRFRVVARENSPAQLRALAVAPSGLTPHDLGWLDTVLVWPGERVRIALDASQPFQGDQTYMFHCHNLEHEDQGLMLSFRITD